MDIEQSQIGKRKKKVCSGDSLIKFVSLNQRYAHRCVVVAVYVIALNITIVHAVSIHLHIAGTIRKPHMFDRKKNKSAVFS